MAESLTRRQPFLEAVASRVVLFDGGMGTELYARGLFHNRSYEQLNLDKPDLVQEIHAAFLEAGCDVIETNTFSASRPKLETHGLADHIAQVNRRGAEIARKVAGDAAWVAGSVGPLGLRLEPWGPTSVEEASQIFAEQISALVEGGVDLLSLETFCYVDELAAAVEAARKVCDLPIVAMMTVDDTGTAPDGSTTATLARRLEELEADVIGLNCSVGPASMLDAIESFVAISSKPVAAMPNAGTPRSLDGRTFYQTSPAHMGRYAKRLAGTGVRIVGGCCGVTPDHVRAMREALLEEVDARIVPHTAVSALRAVPQDPVPMAQKSGIARCLAEGRFVTACHASAPTGWRPRGVDALVDGAVDAGFNAVLVPDDPRVLPRMSPIALAKLLNDRARDHDLDVVLQYAARDRKLTGAQADLLGAHALGLRNILLTTKSEPRPGEVAWSRASVDLDAIGLTNLAFRLNHGLDVADNAIGDATRFLIGVSAAPGARGQAHEVRRIGWKVDAGAELIITEPVFDAKQLERFLERIEPYRVRTMVTLVPLRSLRHAEYYADEVPGVRVPQAVLDRFNGLNGKSDEDEAAKVGTELFAELVQSVAPLVEGIVVAGSRAADETIHHTLSELRPARAAEREMRGRPGIMGGSEAARYD